MRNAAYKYVEFGIQQDQAEIRNKGSLDGFRSVEARGQSQLFDSRRCAETDADSPTVSMAPGQLCAIANTTAQGTQSGTNLTEAGGLGATFFHSYPQFSVGLGCHRLERFLELSATQREPAVPAGRSSIGELCLVDVAGQAQHRPGVRTPALDAAR